MSNNNFNRNVPMNSGRSSKDTLIDTASNLITSDNPAKWVAGIAVGTIAVAGLAITAISRMER